MNEELEKDLKKLSRAELNESAKEVHGIDNPESYPNAGELVKAILEKQPKKVLNKSVKSKRVQIYPPTKK